MNSQKTLRVGMLGFGVVGGEVARLIIANQKDLTARSGAQLDLVKIGVRNLARPNVAKELLTTDLDSIVKDAEAALASDISELVEVEQISFLGRGWTIGLAHEAALKTRESSQFWAEAYPALDYRHGPLSISQPGRAVWAFGDIPADLVRDIKSTGALFESSTLDPMAHLIRAQRVAIAIAKKRGVDADNPRGLARSIILDK